MLNDKDVQKAYSKMHKAQDRAIVWISVAVVILLGAVAYAW